MDRGVPLKDIKIDCALATDNTVITAVANQTIKIWSIFLWWNGTVSVTLKDGASTRGLTGAMAGTAQNYFKLNLSKYPYFTLTAGNAFIIALSDTVQVSGTVRYTQQA